jgi:putative ABC transport system permease protein
MLSDIRFRLRALFRRRAVETELEQELRFHFESEVEKYKSQGMTPEEALRRARLAFGGHDQIKEDCREARGTNFLESCWHDIRHSLRLLCKNPGFSIIAGLTLALGVGATAIIYSLVDTILLRPLPYPNTNQVAMLWQVAPPGSFFGTQSIPWEPLEFHLLGKNSTAFQTLGAFEMQSLTLTGVASPERLEGARVSAGVFPTLGVSPLLGRTFDTSEEVEDHQYEVVLSNRLWASRFGGDAHIVGKTIELDGDPYTVIGVMPARFTFPNSEGMPPIVAMPKEPQFWMPLAFSAAEEETGELGVIGQLRAGISWDQLQQAMKMFDRTLGQQVPRDRGGFTRVVPLARQTVMNERRPLLLLLGAVSAVLLIACSNVAGLMLNRALGRRREFTLRGALGAKRSRLIRQIMTEGLLLALFGGLMGIALGEAGLSLVKHFGPSAIPHLHETELNPGVMAIALGVTLITATIFGLPAAYGATGVNIVETLKGGGQMAGGSVAAPRIRNALLTAQVALSLVLVIAAGLLVRSFRHMLEADPGFDASQVVTFELPVPSAKYEDLPSLIRLYRNVQTQLQCVPGVRSAGFASLVPMGGSSDAAMIRIQDHPKANDAANYAVVSPGYFKTIGAPILRGRDLVEADDLSTVPVAIINADMARKYWPNKDPIGKQVGIDFVGAPVRTVVGVVGDIKQTSLREEPSPKLFVPYTQVGTEVESHTFHSMQYAVRATGEPASIAGSLRPAVHSVDPDLSVVNFTLLTTLVDASLATDKFILLLFGSFGGLSLLLASIGMYGVITYSVMQRTAEIGVRIALGAGRCEIFLLILRQGSRVVFLGIAIGLIAAFTSTRLMTRFLYGVQPTDPITFAAVTLLQLGVTLLACYFPARKAMSVNPVIAMRYE